MQFNNIQLFKCVSIDASEHKPVIEWLKQNVKPTYSDNSGLPEDLYSIDISEAYMYQNNRVRQEIPDMITQFEEELAKIDKDIFYFRFINH